MSWIPSVITLLGTLAGAIIGIVGAIITQNKSFKRQIELERNKLEWNESQNNKNLKFEVYNELLEKNGVSQVIELDRNKPMDIYQFQVGNYLTCIRPILFKKFHVLDSDIQEKVLRIDEEIRRCEWYEDVDEDDNKGFLDLYNAILRRVNEEYEKMKISGIE
ncbi:hypothetical protein COJ11_30390 [Bacillus cereus]|uniref:hypothetical protein n=1 Tax=Bacillus cereus TaxID=1396 RepID=UPI000BF8B76F|nr:hypothetical protein [Bacillus cereus]PFC50534.1 hypothetical protein CN297_18025 [Bacillus cereus]PFJ85496.1 hypothetical protein COJ11_30390 [Bacillus cereus]PGO72115.1 hypothetical protein CN983_02255 [Bacillus cereus]PGY91559.1 hypothetical protein COE38_17030 [Bacillus cereus]